MSSDRSCANTKSHDPHRHCPGVKPVTIGDVMVSAARTKLIAVYAELDYAIRVRVAELTQDLVDPQAAQLQAYGEFQEDGLLHLYTTAVLNEAGEIIADYDKPSDGWEEFTSQVDALLDEIAERDHDYQGEHDFNVQEP